MKGFAVSPTTKACTKVYKKKKIKLSFITFFIIIKGIWIWGSPLEGQTATGEKINLLVLDSEGLGSTDENQNQDTKLFSLVILFSTMILYNSVVSIDENSFKNLNLIGNLTKHIHIQSKNENSNFKDYSQNFPNFLWIIRDFTLQLVDKDGQEMDSKE